MFKYLRVLEAEAGRAVWVKGGEVELTEQKSVCARQTNSQHKDPPQYSIRHAAVRPHICSPTQILIARRRVAGTAHSFIHGRGGRTSLRACVDRDDCLTLTANTAHFYARKLPSLFDMNKIDYASANKGVVQLSQYSRTTALPSDKVLPGKIDLRFL